MATVQVTEKTFETTVKKGIVLLDFWAAWCGPCRAFEERFAGVVGTAAFKVFDLEVGRTGLGRAEAERMGISASRTSSTHRSRGHAYPGSTPITTILFVEPGSGRLLGAQMVGAEAVTGRIDVLATALHAGMTAEQLESLDLAYAPPLAPVDDPILIAAGVARKALLVTRSPEGSPTASTPPHVG